MRARLRTRHNPFNYDTTFGGKDSIQKIRKETDPFLSGFSLKSCEPEMTEDCSRWWPQEPEIFPGL